MSLELFVVAIGIIAFSLSSRLCLLFMINKTDNKEVSNAMALNLFFESTAVLATLVFAWSAFTGSYSLILDTNLAAFLRTFIFAGTAISSLNLARVIRKISKELPKK